MGLLPMLRSDRAIVEVAGYDPASELPIVSALHLAVYARQQPVDTNHPLKGGPGVRGGCTPRPCLSYRKGGATGCPPAAGAGAEAGACAGAAPG